MSFDGMGAVVLDATNQGTGVGFRVWAPNADFVSVVGDFNEWDNQATQLERSDNGYWSGVVEQAKPGDEYKFYLRNGDAEFFRIDPYAFQVTTSVGNGVIYDQNAFDWGDDAPVIGSFNELVIYELHVGSFFTQEGVGTFEGVQEKLQHLIKLGINAIQIMPVGEFAGDYSWGYNPAHIFAVESAYGGPDALKQLIKAAHASGLAVIMDIVYNHFGPSDLDLWQFDGWSENDKGGIYFFNDHRSETPWGDTRPDYGREEVRNYLRDNAYQWLRDFHVDGLRSDMTPYVRSISGMGRDIPEGWELMRWINTSIRYDFPGRILIAEDMHQDPLITQVDGEGAAFHAQWDSAFVHPVREALIKPEDSWRSAAEVYDALARIYNGDGFHRVIYTESHDEVANGRARVTTEVDDANPQSVWAQKLSTLGAVFTLTGVGIPMLFQGQEFLQGEWFRDDVPLDWELSEDYQGIVRLYRDLIHLRRNADGRSAGLLGSHVAKTFEHEDDNVFSYVRWMEDPTAAGDGVFVVVNLSAETREGYRISAPALGAWKLELNSGASLYSADFDALENTEVGDTEALREDDDAVMTLNLPPYSALVFTRP